MGQMALKLLCWVSLIDLTSSDLIYLINLLFFLLQNVKKYSHFGPFLLVFEGRQDQNEVRYGSDDITPIWPTYMSTFKTI